MEFIWEELGPKFKDLLELGRPGVVASLLAASQRLDTHAQKVCNSKHLSSSVNINVSETLKQFKPSMKF